MYMLPDQDPLNPDHFEVFKIFRFLKKKLKIFILRPLRRAFKLQEKPQASQREHLTLRNIKMSSLFLGLGRLFSLPRPGPDPNHCYAGAF
jgi:hypothetical protein